MATILNNYSISGGDTTSSTFTSAGDCVTVEATTTNLSGVNSLIKIQSSDDQSTWKDIGQIYLGVGSDTYCNDPIKITGLYIRCLLVTNDSISGTITITASDGAAGTGDLLAANNLSDVANAATANSNLGNTHLVYSPVFTDTVGSGTCTLLGESFVIVIDEDSVSFTFQVIITLDALETDSSFTYNLPTGHLPTNNFADDYGVICVVGLPNASQIDSSSIIGYGSNAGAKTAYISYHNDVAGSGAKYSFFVRYHK